LADQLLKQFELRGRVRVMLRRWQIFLGLLLASVLTSQVQAAEYFWQPGQMVIGEQREYVTREGDTLIYLPRDLGLGFAQLLTANRGLDPWHPGIGTRINLPSAYILPDVPHEGIVVNLAQQRLYYFRPGENRVITYPVGVGLLGHSAPVGATKVIEKTKNPTWYPSKRLQRERGIPAVIPPGPDNPLGDYSLRLGWYSYLIHGTHKPAGIGRMVSQGCIRMYPEDIEALFHQVPVGTPVRIVSENVVTAWIGDGLYVQVFPNKMQTASLGATSDFVEQVPAELKYRVTAMAKQREAVVNWDAVTQAGLRRSGMLVRVGTTRDHIAGLSTPYQYR